MKILKASAGSGKTFTLSHSYMDLLLKGNSHKHILAVTFTNKATAEMKSRILEDLDSSEDPSAREILIDILHNYSSFNVLTNDKFFQMALRSFSKEIGQMASYQIELDKKSLIHEAMDRVLDNLTSDDANIIEWILRNVLEKVDEGVKPNLEQGLYTMGERLNSAEFAEISKECNPAEQFSKERLRALHGECRRVMAESEDQLAVNTAVLIDSGCFELGLAAEFFKEYDALLKERNLMCLDDSKVILRDIINGSDAPFVYEKIGTRIDHYLLDEFQDTSTTEWANFLPLLKDSESFGGESLIVGDVKQSIYRFRNSEWKLLHSIVPSEFPNADSHPMNDNWRSCAEIVGFNNGFFTFAARELSCQDIYSDTVQNVRVKDEPQKGRVRVSFTDDQEEAVLSSVREAVSNGAGMSDIAVIVRNNSEGSRIASLLSNAGYPVISDDSLKIKSSAVVRTLIAVLGYLDNGLDRTGSFLASNLGIEFPTSYHSLSDLCEQLLRLLKPHFAERMDEESIFIHGFLDNLQNWTASNGNNLKYFLEWMNDNNPAICTSDEGNSIRVITIHKSKGLEFPYVIFPWAEKVELFRSNNRWCRLDNNIKDFKIDVRGWYPVKMTKSITGNSWFKDSFEQECRMQVIDNLNLFYVALTRAGKELHVIAKTPSKTCRASVGKARKNFSDMSALLFHYCNGMDEWSSGEPYDFTRMVRKSAKAITPIDCCYVSHPLASRLVPSQDSTDFFTGSTDIMTEGGNIRLRGIILHEILSRIDRLEDLEGSVRTSVMEGSLNGEDEAEVVSLLRSRISGHSEWFNGNGLNEAAILDSCGKEHRPDRIVTEKDRTVVIDYKFGERVSKYEDQVRRYMSLLSEMGYRNVVGKVWYIADDTITDVINFE